MFGAKFPLPVMREKIVFSTGGFNVAAATTTYINICDQSGELTGGVAATETSLYNNYLVTRSGLLQNLVAHSSTVPGVGKTYTYTVLVNGIASALTCTISGGASRDASNLINIVNLGVGDRITLQIVTSAGATVNSHAALLQFAHSSLKIPFEHITFSTSSVNIPANTTGYISSIYRNASVAGNYGSVASELVQRLLCLVTRKGILSNLVVLATVAPGAGQTFVYTVRVNSINTAITVTLSGAVQITGADATDRVVVNVGDRIGLEVVTSAAATSTTHIASFDFEEGDYRAG